MGGVLLSNECLDGDGERVGDRWQQGDRHTAAADLVGGDHLLGELEGLGELDLRESMGFAQLADTRSERFEETASRPESSEGWHCNRCGVWGAYPNPHYEERSTPWLGRTPRAGGTHVRRQDESAAGGPNVAPDNVA